MIAYLYLCVQLFTKTRMNITSAGRLKQQSWTQLFLLWWTLINTFQVYGRFEPSTLHTRPEAVKDKDNFFSRAYRVMNKILLKLHLFTPYYLQSSWQQLVRAETVLKIFKKMTPISCLSILGVICVKELATQCKTFLFSCKVNLFLLTVD